MTTTRPVVGRRAIEVLLQAELPRAADRRLVLVDAAYEARGQETEFGLRIDGRTHWVRVSDQDSVLGITDAWQRHRAEAKPDRTDVLVVTGQVPADQLGWDLRAHAVRHHPLAVDRADIVKQLFGAADLDTRMAGERWLIDALLEAEPVDGWPRAGAVLTRDRAVRALIAARLGIGDTTSDTLDLDADTLFVWSRNAAGPARYAALSPAEQEGIGAWLATTVGFAAPTLLALAADGRGTDALPLGALASAALSSTAAEAAGFALGTLFGSALASFDALRPFANAATGVLSRWIAQAEGSGPQRGAARDRVLDVLDRADRLAAEARLSPLIGADRLLPSGYRARLGALASVLDGPAAPAETALRKLTEHQLSGLYAESTDTARTAVRLVRWMRAPLPEVESVAQGVRTHLASSGWADLAVGVLAEGETSRDPAVADAYQRLIGAVRARRTGLDEAFARKLTRWTETACQQAPGGALLIEDVLAQAAAPLARDGGRPLILVLDGMSADVAVQLAGELDRRVWTEVVPKPREGTRPARQAAVSMLPSVTRTSRTSLLCGQAAEGGQDRERSGFTTFWKKRHRGAHLFHKGGFEGPPGHRLAPELLQALATDDIVAVVVNTIDDALGDGREGARGRWSLDDVAKLPDLLNAARDYGRPVLLVSDHGHVLDRTPRGWQQPPAEGVEGARWRTGTPGDGEIAVAGPRVRTPGGRAVLPWREDLRYIARQAGYHGGASLAEVTVPVLTLVPSADQIPAGWTLLPVEDITPDWWRGSDEHPPVESEPDAGAAEGRTRRHKPELQSEGIFAVPGQGSLGEQTVQSAPYKAQREFVRLAPADKAVAAVLDALLTTGGKLSPGAVAAAAQAATGKSQRNPERFATVLERLLNIDGYPVLQLVESGRTVQLDKALLAQQFLGEPT
ncbi:MULTISPECIES: BREX-2 system phosphatase PglZ [Streptomyces]|uniref:BREX-2 system phosphatase PglZ n=1 Tax=Streptomyces TaxID=1883 RepID=UPI001291DAFC|nr:MULTISPECIES: BREX-2 system phosphatase PglZ [Streptomyces]MCX5036865.1 BREX-2 system phosphatase PglZ [Streptomyces coelicoflavus]QFX83065.1 BREX-2 system phosphatase PglZ [Streptomyces sp. SYP-A7193]